MIVTKPSDKIRCYYKIVNMQKPEVLYGKSPDQPGEVAWSLALTPTFEKQNKKKAKTDIVENEEPVSTVLLYGNHLHFIFLVDRGDTMKGPQMQAVKDALGLFLRSLPLNSKFTVLSFGNNAHLIEIKGKSVLDMNEENLMEMLKKV